MFLKELSPQYRMISLVPPEPMTFVQYEIFAWSLRMFKICGLAIAGRIGSRVNTGEEILFVRLRLVRYLTSQLKAR